MLSNEHIAHSFYSGLYKVPLSALIIKNSDEILYQKSCVYPQCLLKFVFHFSLVFGIMIANADGCQILQNYLFDKESNQKS